MIATRTEELALQQSHRHCSMIGQGVTQTSSSPPVPGQPSLSRIGGDASISALACAPCDSILSPPLPATSSPADQRRFSAKAPHPSEVLKCPRCDSLDTKFCYYNNYSLTQPRYFCKNCKRYWTAGGALRNVPVGGGLRKNKRSKLKLAAAAAADAEAALAAQVLAGGGGVKPQAQATAAGEAPQKVDNRTMSGPASIAAPSHLLMGMPEMGIYTHSASSAAKAHVGDGLTNPSAAQYMAEHMADQNGIGCSPAPTLHQQVGNFYVKDDANPGLAYFGDPSQVPQFYSSYAASLPIQFTGNPGVSSGAVSGYAVNFNFFQADPSRDAANEDVGVASGGASAAGPSRRDMKQEKEGEGSANAYDWQIMSEGMFNGTGASDSSFLYAPSSSWPDFSQFNDSGPG